MLGRLSIAYLMLITYCLFQLDQRVREMSESKVQHISAKEAHALMQREPATAFIDVR